VINEEIRLTVRQQFRDVRETTARAIRQNSEKVRTYESEIEDEDRDLEPKVEKERISVFIGSNLADETVLHFPSNASSISPMLFEAHLSLEIDWNLILLKDPLNMWYLLI
jgi:hypothetical protein